MAKQTINLGTQGTVSGDTIRAAFDKANDNFDELYNDNEKVGYYTGDLAATFIASSSTTWVYSSTFGDTLPAGTYLLIAVCLAQPFGLTEPDYHIEQVGIFNGTTTLAASYQQVSWNGYQHIVMLNYVSFASSATLRAGIRRVSGNGTAKAGYFKWHAIKVKDL